MMSSSADPLVAVITKTSLRIPALIAPSKKNATKVAVFTVLTRDDKNVKCRNSPLELGKIVTAVGEPSVVTVTVSVRSLIVIFVAPAPTAQTNARLKTKYWIARFIEHPLPRKKTTNRVRRSRRTPQA